MKHKHHRPAGVRVAAMAGALALAGTALAAGPLAGARAAAAPASSATANPAAQSAEPALVPKPVSVLYPASEKGYTLTTDTCITLPDSSYDAAAQILRGALSRSYGLRLAAGKDCAVRIVADSRLAQQDEQSHEAYTLTVNSKGVTIHAATNRAAIWGVQTLLQLIGPWADAPVKIADEVTVPAVQLKDQPRFAWRGLMIDPARSFIPVAEVKHLIDIMSSVKMNVLHMHLTDDQGWRVEITNEGRQSGDNVDYTQLTKKSGNTAFMAGGSKFAPQAGRAGFYTQDEFVDLVSYAAKHGVSLVPEVDGPGHATAMLHAIPQLNSAHSSPKPPAGKDTADPFTERGHWGQSTLDSENEVTYRVMKHVRDQIAEMVQKGMDEAGMAQFYLPYFHIGGDESLTTTNYGKYMKKISDQFRAEPFKPIVWNDALKKASGSLPNGTLVQYWTTGATGINPHQAAAWASEHDSQIIMSPVRNTYFPQRGSGDIAGPNWGCTVKDSSLPESQRKWCGADDYYNWNPAQMAGVSDSKIKGIEGALWNEHMRTEHDQQFQIFPRAFALAEVGWTEQAKRDFKDFKQRVHPLGVNMIVRDATFQLMPDLVKWTGSAHGVAVENEALGKQALVGLVARPGLKDVSSFPTSGTFRDAAGKDHTVQLSYQMARAFHYTDAGRTTGRVMNSLVKVYATIPADVAKGIGTLTAGNLPGSERVAELPLTFTLRAGMDRTTETAAPPTGGSTPSAGTGGSATATPPATAGSATEGSHGDQSAGTSSSNDTSSKDASSSKKSSSSKTDQGKKDGQGKKTGSSSRSSGSTPAKADAKGAQLARTGVDAKQGAALIMLLAVAALGMAAVGLKRRF